METVVDIVKHAIENEVKAKAFYSKASDIAIEGESQMVFVELVEMEDQHARRLVDAFGDVLQAAGVDAEAFLSDVEAEVERSLGNAEVALLEKAEMRPVIDFAIKMESQARDNYLGLEKRVETDELRRICRDLADEEQQHFNTLTTARSGVDTPLDERPMM